jgi:hypothetical protein
VRHSSLLMVAEQATSPSELMASNNVIGFMASPVPRVRARRRAPCAALGG